MTVPEHLRDELIRLMERGGTVAELLRCARSVLGEDTPQRDWIEAVRSTLGLRVGGWTVVPATESFGTGRVRDSVLTWGFLPEMLANRDKWDTPADERSDEPRWYDGLRRLTGDEYLADAEKSHGLSPEGWAALGEQDRHRVRVLERMRLSLGDDVQLLAALAEQLQRRVNELEGRHEQLNHHPAAAGAA